MKMSITVNPEEDIAILCSDPGAERVILAHS
jgi:hypothetical protein